MNDTTTRLGDMPNDQFLAQTEAVLAVYADKCRMLDQTQRWLAEARDELNNREAVDREQTRTIQRLELQLAEANRARDVALEQSGVLKGIMLSHGASIADVVGRLEPAAAPADQPGIAAGRSGLAAVESAIANGGGERPRTA